MIFIHFDFLLRISVTNRSHIVVKTSYVVRAPGHNTGGSAPVRVTVKKHLIVEKLRLGTIIFINNLPALRKLLTRDKYFDYLSGPKKNRRTGRYHGDHELPHNPISPALRGPNRPVVKKGKIMFSSAREVSSCRAVGGEGRAKETWDMGPRGDLGQRSAIQDESSRADQPGRANGTRPELLVCRGFGWNVCTACQCLHAIASYCSHDLPGTSPRKQGGGIPLSRWCSPSTHTRCLLSLSLTQN